MSVLLVAIAGLSVAQVRSHARMDLGLDTDHLAIIEVDLESQRIGEAETRLIVEAWTAEMSRHPGVAAAAAIAGLPGVSATVSSRGASIGAGYGPTTHSSTLFTATPDVFDTLGISVVRGRGLEAADARPPCRWR